MCGASGPLFFLLLTGCGACTGSGEPEFGGECGEVEIPYNGRDDDCDYSTPDDDLDGDGYGLDEDCDDEDDRRSPGLEESCDRNDNDCDGNVDEEPEDGRSVWPDADGDGWGDPDGERIACAPESDEVTVGDDCDDDETEVHPDAVERCNARDDDCDTVVDEGDEWYRDDDGDGYGDPETPLETCRDADAVADATDCDDTDAEISPDAEEDCTDGVDNDCSGVIDDCTIWTMDWVGLDSVALWGFRDEEQAGTHWAGGFDNNGDGQDDLIIGSPGFDRYGAAYVVHGPVTSSASLYDAEAMIQGDGDRHCTAPVGT